jgi:hypothetical protein
MSKKNLKKIGIIFIVLVCAVGGYAGYQAYQAQHLASSLLTEAEKEAQYLGEGKSAGISGNNVVEVGQGNKAGATNEESGTTSNPNKASRGGGSYGSPGTSTADGSYQQKMASTYNLAIGAMNSVKDNTLALQKRKLSVSQYKGTIVQAKNNFTEAQTFAENNPPSDPELTPYYQEFLAGIILANQSMDTVLKGISSLNPSSLFAAKDMGTTALDKVVNGYKHF